MRKGLKECGSREGTVWRGGFSLRIQQLCLVSIFGRLLTSLLFSRIYEVRYLFGRGYEIVTDLPGLYSTIHIQRFKASF